MVYSDTQFRKQKEFLTFCSGIALLKFIRFQFFSIKSAERGLAVLQDLDPHGIQIVLVFLKSTSLQQGSFSPTYVSVI